MANGPSVSAATSCIRRRFWQLSSNRCRLNPDPDRASARRLKAARASFKDLIAPRSHRACGCQRSCWKTTPWSNPRCSSTTFDRSRCHAKRADDPTDARDAERGARARATERRRARRRRTLWAMARRGRAATERAALSGRGRIRGVLPRVSVSRLERYLDCPFRFFASEVLKLEEQPEDEDTRTPLERGRFLHELFERFFSEWQRRGHRRIDPGSLPEARALFTAMCEDALASLSPAEATLERTRLLGSAVSPGIAHRVFAWRPSAPSRSSSGCSSFRCRAIFNSAASTGERATVTLERKDRSHRSARRRHAARDRLQVEADARPEGGPAVADLQFVRAPIARRAPQSAVDARRSDLSVVRGQSNGCAARKRRAARSTTLIAERRGSPADDARQYRGGALPAAPGEEIAVRAHVRT